AGVQLVFGWYASRVEFQHLCWSPDSRRLAFTARYYDEGSDVEGLESGDVVAWVRVDSQLPVRILTPSVINRVIPDHSGEQLVLTTGWGCLRSILVTVRCGSCSWWMSRATAGTILKTGSGPVPAPG
ncbi:MAG: hypothetical protein ABIK38_03770, partial [candidate division WOR-3 bacterium]